MLAGGKVDIAANQCLPGLPATCVALITDNPKAYAIERAEQAKIPVIIVNYAAYSSRQEYEQALLAVMQRVNPDLFVLAGYMRIVGKEIVQVFSGRMINIHPALLPSFTGLHAQRQAVAYGVKVSGCTVHFVDESLDGGPVIVQLASRFATVRRRNICRGRTPVAILTKLSSNVGVNANFAINI